MQGLLIKRGGDRLSKNRKLVRILKSTCDQQYVNETHRPIIHK